MQCAKKAPIDLNHIKGYWEIETVTLKNGTQKEFGFNATVDYINFNDSLIGFRKKLKPTLTNTYYTTDHNEALKIVKENDSINIYYTTSFSNWKETILEVSDSHLKVVNSDNKTYTYKRYKSIVLDSIQ